MKNKFYEVSILQFDENNVPETKETFCIIADFVPTRENLLEKFPFPEQISATFGDKIGNVKEISREDAYLLYGTDIQLFTKTLPKKIMDVLKEQGFYCPGPSKIFHQGNGSCYAHIVQSTPSGDEWRVEIWFDKHLESFQRGVKRCANIFDVDDEVERLIPCRGEDGHPSSIQTLLDDAKWKKRKLQELSMALKDGLKIKETSKPQEMKKYMVYGNYTFSKFLGEFEAASPDDAVQKALDEVNPNAWLCAYCSQEFEDAGELDEASVVAEEIK